MLPSWRKCHQAAGSCSRWAADGQPGLYCRSESSILGSEVRELKAPEFIQSSGLTDSWLRRKVEFKICRCWMFSGRQKAWNMLFIPQWPLIAVRLMARESVWFWYERVLFVSCFSLTVSIGFFSPRFCSKRPRAVTTEAVKLRKKFSDRTSNCETEKKAVMLHVMSF